VVGDVHEPFSNQAAKKHIYEYCRSYKPDFVVQVGDLYDHYCFSRFGKDARVMPPQLELECGRLQAEEFWWNVGNAAPAAHLVQLLGNHDARAKDRISDSNPALGLILDRGFEALYKFEDVETVMDEKQEYYVEDICFQHGHRSKLGDHAKWNQGKTVVGHSHLGGCVFLRNRKGIYWELNAGWVGDETAAVFNYPAQKINRSWTLGFGVIDRDGPRFLPLG
jgi:hypothetical protein